MFTSYEMCNILSSNKLSVQNLAPYLIQSRLSAPHWWCFLKMRSLVLCDNSIRLDSSLGHNKETSCTEANSLTSVCATISNLQALVWNFLIYGAFNSMSFCYIWWNCILRLLSRRANAKICNVLKSISQNTLLTRISIVVEIASSIYVIIYAGFAP
jgi:hypothetical protein